MPSLSPNLVPASVEKLVAPLKSGSPKADPKALLAAVKQLQDLDKGLDADLFQPFKPASLTQAEVRLGALQKGAVKAAQAAVAQARKTSQAAVALAGAVKADKELAKQSKLLNGINDIASDSKTYADAWTAAAKKAEDEATAALAQLRETAKKAAAKGGAGEDDDEAETDLKKLAPKVIGALKLCQAAPPDKPLKFVVGVLSKQVFVYVGRSNAGSLNARMKTWMNGGKASPKCHRGEVRYQDGTFVFVGTTLPTGGFASRMQRGLLLLTKRRYKLRIERPGQKPDPDDEAPGHGDQLDDILLAAADGSDANAAKARALQQRRKKLLPALERAMAGDSPAANALVATLQRFTDALADDNLDAAKAALDQAEKAIGDATKADEKAGADARKALNARMAKLTAGLKRALAAGGKPADEAKRLSKDYAVAIKGKGAQALAAATKDVEDLEALLSGKAVPSAQDLQDKDQLTRDLKETARQVKELADAKDPRAAEAVKLTKEAGGLLSWETLDKAKAKYKALKELVSGKAGTPEDSPRRAPKGDAEISLDAFNKDLGSAIGNIGKMRTVAKKLGADDLDKHLGKVADGLGAVSKQSGKLAEVAELYRDMEELQRAVNVARSLDLNKDFEQAADAMDDVARITGTLAKKAGASKVPGLEAYVTIWQNAGEIWKMGARIRKRREEEWEKASSSNDPVATDTEPAAPTKVPKSNTGGITEAQIVKFMEDAQATFLEEARTMGGVWSNEAPQWSLDTDYFLKAFADFEALHVERQKVMGDTVGAVAGRLSPKYKLLSKQMKVPYDEAMDRLNNLQRLVGKRDDISVTYEPALKAMAKLAP
ncbi:MAG: hypothetical protein ACKVQR_14135 [Aquabacterium sp.]